MPNLRLNFKPLHAASLCMALCVLPAHAAPARGPTTEGLHFSHLDWEVACDNTRTCRAVGYQADGDQNTVALLLTREAGPRQPVKAQLMLGQYGEEAEQQASAAEHSRALRLQVAGKDLGRLPWQDSGYQLSPEQLKAVLAALPRADARIVFSHGRHTWALSDQGATAVLLKMDEAQGRVGTPGALARPGKRPESQVLPPLPVPVVNAARVPELPPGAAADRIPGLSPPAMAALRKALLVDAGDKRDTDLLPPDEQGFRFEPLGGGQWLASTLCWRAAYNEGYCMWVVNERPPHQPRLVTEMASDHTRGVISSGQKGRGLGDCWGSETWTWYGRAFVHTEASTTGQCKLIAPGGAWNLPTWVTKVVGP